MSSAARRRAIGATVVVALMVGGIVAATRNLTHQEHTRFGGPLPSEPAPTTSSASPTSVPVDHTTTVIDVSFFDKNDGVLLLADCATTCSAFAGTVTDGGSQPQAAYAIPAKPVEGAVLDHIVTPTRSDWLVSGTAGLWATHDRGASWSQIETRAGVVTVAAGAIWFSVCTPIGSFDGCRGDYLARSTDGGRNFMAVANLSGTIVGGSGMRVFRLASGVESPTSLDVTRDEGRTWQPVTVPCGTLLSGAPDGELWLACAGQPGAGNQGKAVYRSGDNGARWTEVASCALDARPCRGTLGEGGYLSDLVAVSKTTAFINLARGGLMVTRDGGVHWNIAIHDETASAGPVRFVDQAHGWVILNDALNRTVDGGRSWQKIGAFLQLPLP